jgi:signal transduction histidine kinase
VVLVVTVAPLVLVSWVGTGSSAVSERMLERLALESPEAAQSLRNPLRRLTIVLLPGATLLAAWLGWRMVRPIERLRDEVRGKEDDVSKAGDLDTSRRDELGDLARSFNRLLDQLESHRRQNEAFVADLAHEFKSPVAAIRVAAEALDQRPAAELDPIRLERIARILRDSGHRLDVLLSQFLELARAEGGMIDAERTLVDVAALARGIAGSFAQDPRYAELAFEVDAPDELSTLGVASGIESALRNLIDNAASFATGRVRVAVRQVGLRIVVEVDDDGPGVDPEDAARVFDRFFTRPRSQVAGSADAGRRLGTGLGLALVRAVAVAHGGTVELVEAPHGGALGEAPHGGARFILELACRPQYTYTAPAPATELSA